MSTNTQNYNLVKPAEDDEYDIGVYNGNMDKVDGAMESISQSINSIASDVSSLQQDITEIDNNFQSVSDRVDQLAPNMIIDPIIENGVVPGCCVLKNVDDDVYVISQKGNGIVNGNNDIVKSGGVASGLVGLEAGYTYFVQDNGTLSTAVSSFKAGFAKSQTELEVTLQNGGRIKEYRESMDKFFVIPGGTGSILVKLSLPTEPKTPSDGVKIHISKDQYNGSGLSWGVCVADITDDAQYKENNEYLVLSELEEGVRYFVKAFNYKDGAYNITNGDNESSCIAGGCTHFYDYDHIDGDTMFDSVGNVSLTNLAVTYKPWIVGNAGCYSGGAKTVAPIELLGTTFSLYFIGSFKSFTPTGLTGDCIFSQAKHMGDGKQSGFGVMIYSDRITVYRGNNEYINTWQKVNFSYLFQLNLKYKIWIQRCGNSFYVWINGQSISPSGSITATPPSGYPFVFATNCWGGDPIDADVDNLLLFNRLVQEDERLNIEIEG